MLGRIASRRGHGGLDALTPEQVREFKADALACTEAPTARRLRGRPAAEKLVVAHGDSWFDYPIGTDIIDCLRRFHGYRVVNHARAGDTLENLVYGTRFDPGRGYRALPSRFGDVLADLRKHRARVLLFSGGGNDVAGEEFAQFLEHAGADLGTLRRAHARHVIGVLFGRVLSDMVERATRAAPGVQVFSHGYGYPHPDGRGVGLGIGLSFIGPWLRPALAAKRIDAETEGASIVRELIDMFNDTLAQVARDHANFHYIDLRGVIGESPRAWVNELHVRNSVYGAVAGVFAERIERTVDWSVPPGVRAVRRNPSRGSRRRNGSRRDR